MVKQAAELTGAFPFLKNEPELAGRILEKGLRQRLPADAAIYREGDLCAMIALVLAGEIRVFKASESGREITLYEIGPGDTCILNASCILANTKYPANAVTRTEVEALLLPAAEFRRLLSHHPALQHFVFALLSQRLVSVMSLLEEVVFGRMDERLADYLLERSENGRLAVTHQIIANDLGTSREVVSRLLKDMERRGRVRLGRNEVVLLELGAG